MIRRTFLTAFLVGGFALTGLGSFVQAQDTPKELTIIMGGPPGNLDPGKGSVGGDNFYINLAYDTLLRIDENNEVQPDLAVSWRYVGEGNKVFELTLREGVKFADGTAMTAENVAASLNFIRTKGRHQQWLATIADIKATGPLTIRLEGTSPNPVLPRLLSQIHMKGSIISPKGLENDKLLSTETFGAGPYMLDTSKTSIGDLYTYVPNPNYWDPKRIHWDKVVLKVVPNQESALAAVIAGQADLVRIYANQVDVATGAGLELLRNPLQITGLLLSDREGKLTPALADVRVRQALNYAIDREAITRALFGDLAQPTTQVSLPGLDGFVPDYDARYPYDVEKAKALLAEAGYPDGFTVKALSSTVQQMDLAPQAVFQQWKKIGVNVDLTTDTTVSGYQANSSSANFSAYAFIYGGLPTFLTSLDWMRPTVTRFNQFGLSDPKLTGLLDEANAAPPEAQSEKYQAAMRYFIDQAWAVPVARTDAIYAYNPAKISGLAVAGGYMPDPAWMATPKQ